MGTTSKSVTLTSSEDEEKDDCMPKIINTISLQGSTDALSFQDDQDDEDVTSLLYPTCEIREENASDNYNKISNEVEKTSGATAYGMEKKEKSDRKEKKRVKLTSLSSFKQSSGPKPRPSTSKDDQYNVVDARKLALQESLFKTKELFDTFLRVCQDQESSTEMERVVDKLSRAYSSTRQEFLGSLVFQNILEAETEKVNTSNAKPWLNLKLVLDEMKHNKILSAPKLKLGDSEDSQDGKQSNDEEPIIECPKKRRHLKKLEKALRQVNLKIKKLEEREVDLEDDNSAYIKLDRYRAQFTKIYTKVCAFKGKLPDADRPYLRKVSFAGTTYPHINRCIERYYNKHREFPDFQDIKKLVIMANKQENIEMAPNKIHQMAAAAFKEFGEMLKRLRQYDDYDVIISYLDQQVDPARDNEELIEELNKNALLFKKKEQEVIDKFAAEDVGLHSDSAELSDKVKIKKKIITTTRKKKPPPLSLPVKTKRQLSSSDSSDEEPTNPVTRKPAPSLSSSSNSKSSDSDSEKFDTKTHSTKFIGKGKSIAGKRMLVKKGKKLNTPKKLQKPTISSSSDEESSPKNTKDTLTSYLGLQVSPLKNETKEVKAESDKEEIKYIERIQKPLINKNVKSSSDSDSSVLSRHVPLIKEVDVDSKKSCSENDGANTTCTSNTQKNITNVEENTSSSESIDIVKEVKKFVPKPPTKNVTNKRPISDSKKKNVLLEISNLIYSDSDSDRTSDEKSIKNGKKSVSDVEISEGTQDLSSDSSYVETKEEDDSIVILSEEINNSTKNGPDLDKTSGDSSDSEVCILPQDSKKSTKTSALTRAKDEDHLSSACGSNPQRTSSHGSNSTIKKKRLGFATSTPNHKTKSILDPKKSTKTTALSSVKDDDHLQSTAPKRRLRAHTSSPTLKTKPIVIKRTLSSQRNDDRSSKKPRRSSFTNNMNGTKQTTLPQMINGATRKTVISRVLKMSCRSPESPDSIPLIELD